MRLLEVNTGREIDIHSEQTTVKIAFSPFEKDSKKKEWSKFLNFSIDPFSDGVYCA